MVEKTTGESMIEPTYNGKKIEQLNDDELFEYLTKIRNLRCQGVSEKYHTLGDSLDFVISHVEEEYKIRLYKEMNKINNDPINLGSIDGMDDTEL